MSRLVTATLRDEFRDQGVVFIGKALDADSMRMAEDAYSWSLAHPSPGAANFPHKDSAATFYQDLAKSERDSGIPRDARAVADRRHRLGSLGRTRRLVHVRAGLSQGSRPEPAHAVASGLVLSSG